MSIFSDFARYFSVKTARGRIRLLIIVTLVALSLLYFRNDVQEVEAPKTQFPVVSLLSTEAVASNRTVSFIGTVRTTNEETLLSETSGRVVAVPVRLGGTVSPGGVVARLESSSEYASLLQAEGVYDAAVAAASISDISVNEAKIGVVTATDQVFSAAESAYATLNNVYFNQLDSIVADETNVYRTNGVVLMAEAERLRLINSTFTALADHLTELQRLTTEADSDRVDTTISQALRVADDIQTIVTAVRTLIQNDERDESYDADEATMLATLSTVDGQLSAVRTAVRAAETGLDRALEAVSKAEFAASNNSVSASDAQRKQALGALRAAQANYEKTIIRSVTGGVINELSVSVGDFVNSFQPVAQIINENAFSITLYADERDRDLLVIGNAVTIEGDIAGVITEVAPGINSTTGKVEFTVVSEDSRLVAGDTVRIEVTVSTSDTTEISQTSSTTRFARIPTNAIKFQVEQGFVFTVSDKSTLIAHPVTIGRVDARGVEVVEGMPDSPIVSDARGLSAGETVTVK